MAGCAAGGLSNEYITIAKYDGVEVPAVEGYSEVEDDAVERRIEEIMDGFAEYTEVTDRPIQEGDTIFVNYTAEVEGEVIEDEAKFMELLETMAECAKADGCTKTNPIIPSIEQFKDLFVKAYKG